MSFKGVVFDLDGTLLDTLDDLADCANRILAANRFPTHPTQRYRYFVGDGLQVLLERIVPEGERDSETINRLSQAFKEDYSRNWKVRTRIYTGVSEMLTALEQAGLTLSVLSNKPHEFTCICVRQMLPSWTFESVFGARPGVPKKPDPAAAIEIAQQLQFEPAEFLYLGDTATDMKTATAAGMYPIGALWGFRTAEELKSSGAAGLISKPQQLLDHI